MTDTFDHELDAYESYYRDDDGGGGSYNPDHYHHWYDFYSLVSQTDKSYLIEFKKDFKIFIPKKIVRKIEGNRMFAHGSTFIAIVRTELKKLKEAA